MDPSRNPSEFSELLYQKLKALQKNRRDCYSNTLFEDDNFYADNERCGYEKKTFSQVTIPRTKQSRERDSNVAIIKVRFSVEASSKISIQTAHTGKWRHEENSFATKPIFENNNGSYLTNKYEPHNTESIYHLVEMPSQDYDTKEQKQQMERSSKWKSVLYMFRNFFRTERTPEIVWV